MLVLAQTNGLREGADQTRPSLGYIPASATAHVGYARRHGRARKNKTFFEQNSRSVRTKSDTNLKTNIEPLIKTTSPF
jgi:hypothetical protein